MIRTRIARSSTRSIAFAARLGLACSLVATGCLDPVPDYTKEEARALGGVTVYNAACHTRRRTLIEKWRSLPIVSSWNRKLMDMKEGRIIADASM